MRSCLASATARRLPAAARAYARAARISRDGDTLAMIAERFGTTMLALLERNPNLTPNDFTNGQAICV